MNTETQKQLSRVKQYPTSVELSHHKEEVVKVLGLLINPKRLKSWAKKKYPNSKKAVVGSLTSTPLIIISGISDFANTNLARKIRKATAEQEDMNIDLLSLNLATSDLPEAGVVAKSISSAFEKLIAKARKMKDDTLETKEEVLLLINESKVLSSSSNESNCKAFIRGIKRVGNYRLPSAIILCTKELESLDPKIKRRAAAILNLERRTIQKQSVKSELILEEFGFSLKEIDELESIIEKNQSKKERFSSTLVHRFLPEIITENYSGKKVEARRSVDDVCFHY